MKFTFTKFISITALLLLSYISYSAVAPSNCKPNYLYGCSYMGINSVAVDTGGKTPVILSSNTGCGFQNTQTAALKITKGQPTNVSFTLFYPITPYAQKVSIYIDMNKDFKFDSTERFSVPNAVYYQTNTEYQIPITLPTSMADGLNYTMRVMSFYSSDIDSNGCSSFSYGEYEDYIITPVTKNQQFNSASISYLSENLVLPNAKNIVIGNVNIQTKYTGNPHQLTNLSLKFKGDTNAINNYKLYTTKSYNTFNSPKLVTSKYTLKPISKTDSVLITFISNQTIDGGDNYFWVTGDITSVAVPNDTLKGSVQTITLLWQKKNYVIVPQGADTIYTSNVINYNRPVFEKFPEQPMVSYFQYHTISQRMYYWDYTDSGYVAPLNYLFTTLNAGANYSTSFSTNGFKGAKNIYAALFIDYNKDGKYSGAEEFINFGAIDSLNNLKDFVVPTSTSEGAYRLRLMLAERPLLNTDFASRFTGVGEARDYTIKVVKYSKSTINNINLYCDETLRPSQNTSKVKVLKIKISQDNNLGSKTNINTFNLKTSGFNNLDVANAKLWYSGNNTDFNYAIQVGSTVSKPFGTFTISPNMPFVSGESYFWLTYDVASTAKNGDSLRAFVNSISFSDGSTIVPNEMKPGNETFNLYEKNVIVANEVNSSNIVLTTCSAKWYDDGGADKKYSSKGFVQTVKSSTANYNVKVRFTEFNTNSILNQNSNTDTLYVYDGASTKDSLIGKVTRELFIQNYYYLSYTSSGDALTFQFKPKADTLADGWKAELSCEYNCNKNTFTAEVKLDTAKCTNELHTVHVKILSGFTKPYILSYSDGEGGNNQFKFYTDTFTVKIDPYYYNFNLENGVFCIKTYNLPRGNNVNYYLYKYSTFPTCYKAKDGKLSLSSSLYDTSVVYTWKSATRSGTGSVIDKLAVGDKFYVKAADKNNNCVVDSVTYSPYEAIPSVKDSTTSLIPASAPSISLSIFSAGDTLKSQGQVLPTKSYFTQGYTQPLPDSVAWHFSPKSAAYVSKTDTTTTINWKTGYSGNIKVWAQMFKSGCKGGISTSSTVTIKPSIKLAGSDSLKLGNLKDTAKFDLNLIGTAPFTVFVLKSNGDTLKIRNVKNNKLLLPPPARGSFEILSAIDSLGLRSNVISKKLKVGYDTISYINYTTEKICGQNYKANFTVTGGLAPYQLILQERKFLGIPTKSDTLPEGQLFANIKSNTSYYVIALDKNKYEAQYANSYLYVNDTSKTSGVPTPIISGKDTTIYTSGVTLLSYKTNIDSAKTGYTVKWFVSPSNAVESITSSSSNLQLNVKQSFKGDITIKTVANSTNCYSDTSIVRKIRVIINYDSVKSINYTTEKICGQNYKANFTVTGGQAPYQMILQERVINQKPTKSDTLPVGQLFANIKSNTSYYVIVLDKNKYEAKYANSYVIVNDTSTKSGVPTPIISGSDTTIYATGVTLPAYKTNIDSAKTGYTVSWFVSPSNAVESISSNSSYLQFTAKENITGDITIKAIASTSTCYSDTSIVRRIRVKPYISINKLTPSTLDVTLYGAAPFRLTYIAKNVQQDTVFTSNGNQVINFNTGLAKGDSIIAYILEDARYSDTLNIVTYVTRNSKPLANADFISTKFNQSITYNVLANDFDTLGLNRKSIDFYNQEGFRVPFKTSTGKGTFTADSLGNITFVPANNFVGYASVYYTVYSVVNVASDSVKFTVLVGAKLNDDAIMKLSPKNSTAIKVTENDIIASKNYKIDLNPTQSGIQTSFTSNIGTFTVKNDYILFDPFLDSVGVVNFKYSIFDSVGVETDHANIRVSTSSQLEFYEGFSPNGDEINDKFYIRYLTTSSILNLEVFDLNGFRVYKKENYKNDWDGVKEDGTKTDGIYYYKYTFKENNTVTDKDAIKDAGYIHLKTDKTDK